MKRGLRGIGVVASSALLAACVTVNVYFPAAAAERVADRIVKEVYGLEGEAPARTPAETPAKTPPEPTPEPRANPAEEPEAALPPGELTPTAGLGQRVLGFLVPDAHAQQPDLDVSSPAITELKAAMHARHGALTPHYASGAIGMAASGLLVLREPQAVPLKDRQAVAALIAAENRDRNALYREIATANGHPEWEAEIRTIFDRRWVANAPAGWWFEDARGNWTQK